MPGAEDAGDAERHAMLKSFAWDNNRLICPDPAGAARATELEPEAIPAIPGRNHNRTRG